MNVKEDNNVIKLKKDVVKNVAIVFLTIMLLLTFFSNSIMNKSLPEVATQYVQSGTITEKIRGTGMVEADDPYSVMVTETRTVESVAVKVGDEVTKDQVLFYLEDGDSDELDEAQKALEDLILKYTTGALTGEMTDGAYKNATTGKVLGMNSYEAQIEAAKNRVKAAQDVVDSLDRQIALADGTVDVTSDAEINQAKLELEKAQIVLTNAESEYNAIKAVVEAGGADVASAKAETDLAETKRINAEGELSRKQGDFSQIISDITDYYSSSFGEFKSNHSSVTNGTTAVAFIFDVNNTNRDQVINEWINEATNSTSLVDDANKQKALKAFDEYSKAQATLTEALVEYNTKQQALASATNQAGDYNTAIAKLATAENAYNSAKNYVSELQTKITALTNAQLDNNAANDIARKQLASDLAIRKLDATTELAKAKEDQAQLLVDISKTLDLVNQNSIIREQQEKVEKLREKMTGSVVQSPVDGIVLSIGKHAGEKTSAADPIATIQVNGKPMSMSFSVTDQQAKKVRIGDEASLQNAWYYSDNVRIVLTKIANDPNNPGRSKLLMFNVEGEVSNGESLSVTMGQRAKEYSMVVPNSAIREDNSGKFIYIIEEKGTPFGNRYKAKKVQVEVLASDDNNTAIEAAMDSWVYVITTSNKPIESGQQVRLSDR